MNRINKQGFIANIKNSQPWISCFNVDIQTLYNFIYLS